MHVINGIEVGAASGVSCLASGLTTIASITNPGFKRLCFHFDVATQANDDLNVYGAAHASAQLQDFTPTWSSLSAAAGRMLKALVSTTSSGAAVDTDLDTVATSQNGYFEMDIEGLSLIVIKASAAVDGAVITPRWSLH